ncbi:putative Protein tyrosine and serine/threonine kinase [Monocercomonoides exilis]|uniref:putative Protein tyrosine and serine/threonine kinase n=1 Tax=Monocercomonoides exilis TaxID=2049356 RepID=UPI003559F7E8|nr:putative Protein tyrosine and serine/threonine kinase [Monocercomonoides exilis]
MEIDISDIQIKNCICTGDDGSLVRVLNADSFIMFGAAISGATDEESNVLVSGRGVEIEGCGKGSVTNSNFTGLVVKCTGFSGSSYEEAGGGGLKAIVKARGTATAAATTMGRLMKRNGNGDTSGEGAGEEALLAVTGCRFEGCKVIGAGKDKALLVGGGVWCVLGEKGDGEDKGGEIEIRGCEFCSCWAGKKQGDAGTEEDANNTEGRGGGIFLDVQNTKMRFYLEGVTKGDEGGDAGEGTGEGTEEPVVAKKELFGVGEGEECYALHGTNLFVRYPGSGDGESLKGNIFDFDYDTERAERRNEMKGGYFVEDGEGGIADEVIEYLLIHLVDWNESEGAYVMMGKKDGEIEVGGEDVPGCGRKYLPCAGIEFAYGNAKWGEGANDAKIVLSGEEYTIGEPIELLAGNGANGVRPGKVIIDGAAGSEEGSAEKMKVMIDIESKPGVSGRNEGEESSAKGAITSYVNLVIQNVKFSLNKAGNKSSCVVWSEGAGVSLSVEHVEFDGTEISKETIGWRVIHYEGGSNLSMSDVTVKAMRLSKSMIEYKCETNFGAGGEGEVAGYVNLMGVKIDDCKVKVKEDGNGVENATGSKVYLVKVEGGEGISVNMEGVTITKSVSEEGCGSLVRVANVGSFVMKRAAISGATEGGDSSFVSGRGVEIEGCGKGSVTNSNFTGLVVKCTGFSGSSYEEAGGGGLKAIVKARGTATAAATTMGRLMKRNGNGDTSGEGAGEEALLAVTGCRFEGCKVIGAGKDKALLVGGGVWCVLGEKGDGEDKGGEIEIRGCEFCSCWAGKKQGDAGTEEDANNTEGRGGGIFLDVQNTKMRFYLEGVTKGDEGGDAGEGTGEGTEEPVVAKKELFGVGEGGGVLCVARYEFSGAAERDERRVFCGRWRRGIADEVIEYLLIHLVDWNESEGAYVMMGKKDGEIEVGGEDVPGCGRKYLPCAGIEFAYGNAKWGEGANDAKIVLSGEEYTIGEPIELLAGNGANGVRPGKVIIDGAAGSEEGSAEKMKVMIDIESKPGVSGRNEGEEKLCEGGDYELRNKSSCVVWSEGAGVSLSVEHVEFDGTEISKETIGWRVIHYEGGSNLSMSDVTVKAMRLSKSMIEYKCETNFGAGGEGEVAGYVNLMGVKIDDCKVKVKEDGNGVENATGSKVYLVKVEGGEGISVNMEGVTITKSVSEEGCGSLVRVANVGSFVMKRAAISGATEGGDSSFVSGRGVEIEGCGKGSVTNSNFTGLVVKCTGFSGSSYEEAGGGGLKAIVKARGTATAAATTMGRLMKRNGNGDTSGEGAGEEALLAVTGCRFEGCKVIGAGKDKALLVGGGVWCVLGEKGDGEDKGGEIEIRGCEFCSCWAGKKQGDAGTEEDANNTEGRGGGIFLDVQNTKMRFYLEGVTKGDEGETRERGLEKERKSRWWQRRSCLGLVKGRSAMRCTSGAAERDERRVFCGRWRRGIADEVIEYLLIHLVDWNESEGAYVMMGKKDGEIEVGGEDVPGCGRKYLPCAGIEFAYGNAKWGEGANDAKIVLSGEEYTIGEPIELLAGNGANGVRPGKVIIDGAAGSEEGSAEKMKVMIDIESKPGVSGRNEGEESSAKGAITSYVNLVIQNVKFSLNKAGNKSSCVVWSEGAGVSLSVEHVEFDGTEISKETIGWRVIHYEGGSNLSMSDVTVKAMRLSKSMIEYKCETNFGAGGEGEVAGYVNLMGVKIDDCKVKVKEDGNGVENATGSKVYLVKVEGGEGISVNMEGVTITKSVSEEGCGSLVRVANVGSFVMKRAAISGATEGGDSSFVSGRGVEIEGCGKGSVTNSNFTGLVVKCTGFSGSSYEEAGGGGLKAIVKARGTATAAATTMGRLMKRNGNGDTSGEGAGEEALLAVTGCRFEGCKVIGAGKDKALLVGGGVWCVLGEKGDGEDKGGEIEIRGCEFCSCWAGKKQGDAGTEEDANNTEGRGGGIFLDVQNTKMRFYLEGVTKGDEGETRERDWRRNGRAGGGKEGASGAAERDERRVFCGRWRRGIADEVIEYLLIHLVDWNESEGAYVMMGKKDGEIEVGGEDVPGCGRKYLPCAGIEFAYGNAKWGEGANDAKIVLSGEEYTIGEPIELLAGNGANGVRPGKVIIDGAAGSEEGSAEKMKVMIDIESKPGNVKFSLNKAGNKSSCVVWSEGAGVSLSVEHVEFDGTEISKETIGWRVIHYEGGSNLSMSDVTVKAMRLSKSMIEYKCETNFGAGGEGEVAGYVNLMGVKIDDCKVKVKEDGNGVENATGSKVYLVKVEGGEGISVNMEGVTITKSVSEEGCGSLVRVANVGSFVMKRAAISGATEGGDSSFVSGRGVEIEGCGKGSVTNSNFTGLVVKCTGFSGSSYEEAGGGGLKAIVKARGTATAAATTMGRLMKRNGNGDTSGEGAGEEALLAVTGCRFEGCKVIGAGKDKALLVGGGVGDAGTEEDANNTEGRGGGIFLDVQNTKMRFYLEGVTKGDEGGRRGRGTGEGTEEPVVAKKELFGVGEGEECYALHGTNLFVRYPGSGDGENWNESEGAYVMMGKKDGEIEVGGEDVPGCGRKYLPCAGIEFAYGNAKWGEGANDAKIVLSGEEYTIGEPIELLAGNGANGVRPGKVIIDGAAGSEEGSAEKMKVMIDIESKPGVSGRNEGEESSAKGAITSYVNLVIQNVKFSLNKAGNKSSCVVWSEGAGVSLSVEHVEFDGTEISKETIGWRVIHYEGGSNLSMSDVTVKAMRLSKSMIEYKCETNFGAGGEGEVAGYVNLMGVKIDDCKVKVKEDGNGVENATGSKVYLVKVEGGEGISVNMEGVTITKSVSEEGCGSLVRVANVGSFVMKRAAISGATEGGDSSFVSGRGVEIEGCGKGSVTNSNFTGLVVKCTGFSGSSYEEAGGGGLKAIVKARGTATAAATTMGRLMKRNGNGDTSGEGAGEEALLAVTGCRFEGCKVIGAGKDKALLVGGGVWCVLGEKGDGEDKGGEIEIRGCEFCSCWAGKKQGDAGTEEDANNTEGRGGGIFLDVQNTKMRFYLEGVTKGDEGGDAGEGTGEGTEEPVVAKKELFGVGEGEECYALHGTNLFVRYPGSGDGENWNESEGAYVMMGKKDGEIEVGGEDVPGCGRKYLPCAGIEFAYGNAKWGEGANDAKIVLSGEEYTIGEPIELLAGNGANGVRPGKVIIDGAAGSEEGSAEKMKVMIDIESKPGVSGRNEGEESSAKGRLRVTSCVVWSEGAGVSLSVEHVEFDGTEISKETIGWRVIHYEGGSNLSMSDVTVKAMRLSKSMIEYKCETNFGAGGEGEVAGYVNLMGVKIDDCKVKVKEDGNGVENATGSKSVSEEGCGSLVRVANVGSFVMKRAAISGATEGGDSSFVSGRGVEIEGCGKGSVTNSNFTGLVVKCTGFSGSSYEEAGGGGLKAIVKARGTATAAATTMGRLMKRNGNGDTSGEGAGEEALLAVTGCRFEGCKVIGAGKDKALLVGGGVWCVLGEKGDGEDKGGEIEIRGCEFCSCWAGKKQGDAGTEEDANNTEGRGGGIFLDVQNTKMRFYLEGVTKGDEGETRERGLEKERKSRWWQRRSCLGLVKGRSAMRCTSGAAERDERRVFCGRWRRGIADEVIEYLLIHLVDWNESEGAYVMMGKKDGEIEVGGKMFRDVGGSICRANDAKIVLSGEEYTIGEPIELLAGNGANGVRPGKVIIDGAAGSEEGSAEKMKVMIDIESKPGVSGRNEGEESSAKGAITSYVNLVIQNVKFSLNKAGNKSSCVVWSEGAGVSLSVEHVEFDGTEISKETIGWRVIHYEGGSNLSMSDVTVKAMRLSKSMIEYKCETNFGAGGEGEVAGYVNLMGVKIDDCKVKVKEDGNGVENATGSKVYLVKVEGGEGISVNMEGVTITKSVSEEGCGSLVRVANVGSFVMKRAAISGATEGGDSSFVSGRGVEIEGCGKGSVTNSNFTGLVVKCTGFSGSSYEEAGGGGLKAIVKARGTATAAATTMGRLMKRNGNGDTSGEGAGEEALLAVTGCRFEGCKVIGAGKDKALLVGGGVWCVLGEKGDGEDKGGEIEIRGCEFCSCWAGKKQGDAGTEEDANNTEGRGGGIFLDVQNTKMRFYLEGTEEPVVAKKELFGVGEGEECYALHGTNLFVRYPGSGDGENWNESEGAYVMMGKKDGEIEVGGKMFRDVGGSICRANDAKIVLSGEEYTIGEPIELLAGNGANGVRPGKVIIDGAAGSEEGSAEKMKVMIDIESKPGVSGRNEGEESSAKGAITRVSLSVEHVEFDGTEISKETIGWRVIHYEGGSNLSMSDVTVKAMRLSKSMIEYKCETNFGAGGEGEVAGYVNLMGVKIDDCKVKVKEDGNGVENATGSKVYLVKVEGGEGISVNMEGVTITKSVSEEGCGSLVRVANVGSFVMKRAAISGATEGGDSSFVSGRGVEIEGCGKGSVTNSNFTGLVVKCTGFSGSSYEEAGGGGLKAIVKARGTATAAATTMGRLMKRNGNGDTSGEGAGEEALLAVTGCRFEGCKVIGAGKDKALLVGGGVWCVLGEKGDGEDKGGEIEIRGCEFCSCWAGKKQGDAGTEEDANNTEGRGGGIFLDVQNTKMRFYLEGVTKGDEGGDAGEGTGEGTEEPVVAKKELFGVGEGEECYALHGTNLFVRYPGSGDGENWNESEGAYVMMGKKDGEIEVGGEDVPGCGRKYLPCAGIEFAYGNAKWGEGANDAKIVLSGEEYTIGEPIELLAGNGANGVRPGKVIIDGAAGSEEGSAEKMKVMIDIESKPGVSGRNEGEESSAKGAITSYVNLVIQNVKFSLNKAGNKSSCVVWSEGAGVSLSVEHVEFDGTEISKETIGWRVIHYEGGSNLSMSDVTVKAMRLSKSMIEYKCETNFGAGGEGEVAGYVNLMGVKIDDCKVKVKEDGNGVENATGSKSVSEEGCGSLVRVANVGSFVMKRAAISGATEGGDSSFVSGRGVEIEGCGKGSVTNSNFTGLVAIVKARGTATAAATTMGRLMKRNGNGDTSGEGAGEEALLAVTGCRFEGCKVIGAGKDKALLVGGGVWCVLGEKGDGEDKGGEIEIRGCEFCSCWAGKKQGDAGTEEDANNTEGRGGGIFLDVQNTKMRFYLEGVTKGDEGETRERGLEKERKSRWWQRRSCLGLVKGRSAMRCTSGAAERDERRVFCGRWRRGIADEVIEYLLIHLVDWNESEGAYVMMGKKDGEIEVGGEDVPGCGRKYLPCAGIEFAYGNAKWGEGANDAKIVLSGEEYTIGEPIELLAGNGANGVRPGKVIIDGAAGSEEGSAEKMKVMIDIESKPGVSGRNEGEESSAKGAITSYVNLVIQNVKFSLNKAGNKSSCVVWSEGAGVSLSVEHVEFDGTEISKETIGWRVIHYEGGSNLSMSDVTVKAMRLSKSMIEYKCETNFGAGGEGEVAGYVNLMGVKIDDCKVKVKEDGNGVENATGSKVYLVKVEGGEGISVNMEGVTITKSVSEEGCGSLVRVANVGSFVMKRAAISGATEGGDSSFVSGRGVEIEGCGKGSVTNSNFTGLVVKCTGFSGSSYEEAGGGGLKAIVKTGKTEENLVKMCEFSNKNLINIDKDFEQLIVEGCQFENCEAVDSDERDMECSLLKEGSKGGGIYVHNLENLPMKMDMRVSDMNNCIDNKATFGSVMFLSAKDLSEIVKSTTFNFLASGANIDEFLGSELINDPDVDAVPLFAFTLGTFSNSSIDDNGIDNYICGYQKYPCASINRAIEKAKGNSKRVCKILNKSSVEKKISLEYSAYQCSIEGTDRSKSTLTTKDDADFQGKSAFEIITKISFKTLRDASFLIAGHEDQQNDETIRISLSYTNISKSNANGCDAGSVSYSNFTQIKSSGTHGGCVAMKKLNDNQQDQSLNFSQVRFNSVNVDGSESQGGSMYLALDNKMKLLINNSAFSSSSANLSNGRGGALLLNLLPPFVGSYLLSSPTFKFNSAKCGRDVFVYATRLSTGAVMSWFDFSFFDGYDQKNALYGADALDLKDVDLFDLWEQKSSVVIIADDGIDSKLCGTTNIPCKSFSDALSRLEGDDKYVQISGKCYITSSNDVSGTTIQPHNEDSSQSPGTKQITLVLKGNESVEITTGLLCNSKFFSLQNASLHITRELACGAVIDSAKGHVQLTSVELAYEETEQAANTLLKRSTNDPFQITMNILLIEGGDLTISEFRMNGLIFAVSPIVLNQKCGNVSISSMSVKDTVINDIEKSFCSVATPSDRSPTDEKINFSLSHSSFANLSRSLSEVVTTKQNSETQSAPLVFSFTDPSPSPSEDENDASDDPQTDDAEKFPVVAIKNCTFVCPEQKDSTSFICVSNSAASFTFCTFDANVPSEPESLKQLSLSSRLSNSILKYSSKANSKANSGQLISNEDFCSWNGSLLKFTQANGTVTETVFAGTTNGAVCVDGGNISFSECKFTNNTISSSLYPSARRNLKCSNKAIVTLSSLKGGDGFSKTDPLWILNDGCELNGIPSERNSSLFVPTVTSFTNKTDNTNYKLTFKGTYLFPCDLAYHVKVEYIQEKEQEEQQEQKEEDPNAHPTTITDFSFSAFVSESEVVGQIPKSVIDDAEYQDEITVWFSYEKGDVSKTRSITSSLILKNWTYPPQPGPEDPYERIAKMSSQIKNIVIALAVVFVIAALIVIVLVICALRYKKQRNLIKQEKLKTDDTMKVVMSTHSSYGTIRPEIAPPENTYSSVSQLPLLEADEMDDEDEYDSSYAYDNEEESEEDNTFMGGLRLESVKAEPVHSLKADDSVVTSSDISSSSSSAVDEEPLMALPPKSSSALPVPVAPPRFTTPSDLLVTVMPTVSPFTLTTVSAQSSLYSFLFSSASNAAKEEEAIPGKRQTAAKPELAPDEVMGVVLSIINGLTHLNEIKDPQLGMIYGQLSPMSVYLGGANKRQVFLAVQNIPQIETLRWVAPDVNEDGVGTEQSSVFSLGLLMYAMLFGQMPFEDMNPVEASLAIAAGKRPDISGAFDSTLTQLLMECWQKSAQKRPSLRELESTLRMIIQLYSQENEATETAD